MVNIGFYYKKSNGMRKHIRIDTLSQSYRIYEDDREYNNEVEVKRMSDLELIIANMEHTYYREES